MNKSTPRKHLSQRLEERTGGVQPSDLKAALRMGQHVSVAQLSNTRTLCVAKVNDEVVWFIYSKTRREVVTILPLTAHEVRRALDNHRHKVPEWARWQFNGQDRQSYSHNE